MSPTTTLGFGGGTFVVVFFSKKTFSSSDYF